MNKHIYKDCPSCGRKVYAQLQCVYCKESSAEELFDDISHSNKFCISWLGGSYQGELLASRPHGKGIFTLPDGLTYKGEWVEGKPSGYGTVKYKSGGFYQGEFLSGKRHGQGLYHGHEGIIKAGIWEKGKLIRTFTKEEHSAFEASLAEREGAVFLNTNAKEIEKENEIANKIVIDENEDSPVNRLGFYNTAYELEVIRGLDSGKNLYFHAGENIVIGRDAIELDLCLNDKKVSTRHAKLSVDNNGNILLYDEDSTNGTFLRGKQIQAEALILPGDTFQIGESVLRLKKVQNEPDDIANKKASSGKMHHIHQGTVYIAPGSEHRSIQLEQKEQVINIGRDQSNDIVLNHPMVSRFHASIRGSDGQFFINDLNSSNGTYVNGQRILKQGLLSPDSLVQICAYKLFFDGKKLFEYDENKGQVRIELNNLSKTVLAPNGSLLSILDDINLVIEPSEFVAILGGSGAGKSTLLGALTGMRPATSGSITINGRDFYEEYSVFRSMIGYVPQDDIVHMELSVSEVLTYSARLRMPPDTDMHEIEALVDDVMEVLELTPRKNNLVKSLSGGQRKRVSIGVELLTKPSLFFLDEPTSGLDPGLEKIMMELMRRLANKGHTIILVTHATFNISLCDKVIFLAEGGKLAFYGTPAEALRYFKANDFAEVYNKIATEKHADQWVKDFASSDTAKRLAFLKMKPKKHNGNIEKDIKPGISSLKQWRILTARYGRIMIRDRKNILLLLLQPILIAALIVMTFNYTSPTFEFSLHAPGELAITDTVIAQERIEEILDIKEAETSRRFNMTISVAIMIFSAIWLGTSNAAREIVKELSIYKRERLINLRIGPYLLSKVAVLAFACMVQAVIFVFIVSTGLSMPEFWLNTWAFFLVSLVSIMMGLTISAIASETNNAITAVPLLLVPQIILSGAIVPVEKVTPEIFQIVFYAAVSKWGYELVGGAILDINSRVALENQVQALSGSLAGHWWVLIGSIPLLLVISALALKRKDSKLD